MRLRPVPVLYCTLLASSQNEAEKLKIRSQMNCNPSLAKILRQLDVGKAEDNGDTEVTRVSRKKDMSSSNGSASEGNFNINTNRDVLDLEDLVFSQGSHFMSNKRCQLPDGSFRKQRKGLLLLLSIRFLSRMW